MTNLERAKKHIHGRLNEPARRYCGAGAMLDEDVAALAALLDEVEAARATTETTKPRTMNGRDRAPFIRELARFLVGDQAIRSIQLEAGSKGAREWAALRGTTPLFGYPTVAEAEATLAAWLGLELEPTVSSGR